MKANELMIGDWVYVNGLTQQVFDLAYNQNEKELTIGVLDPQGDVYQCFYGFDHVEPIPLDSEIMKNFGFICSYDDYHQWYIETNHNNLWLEQSRTEPHTYFMRVFNDIKARYVHELQHALRLCGIEKEIKL